MNNELKSFSYSVSHDLRSPLRTINGFNQAILEDYGHLFDHTARDYFNRVINASNHMGELIEVLLKLSRITRSDLHFTRINLSKMVEEISEELKIQQPDREVGISIEENLFVKGDITLLKVAMENLLGNAWKYTSRVETPHIKFGCETTNEETVYYIKDNGAGFSMEYAMDLFTPFKRLHTKEEFSGTGIGLATVQRIIQRHGGRIWAEAVENEGAKFNFTLGI